MPVPEIHIALLRGINVVGKNMVAMAALREMLGELGFSNVRSLLQSGNVVLEGGRRTGPSLEKFLERETAKRLGATVNYMVRTTEEWREVITGNPFTDQARDDPSHLLVMFLKNVPSPSAVEALRAAIVGPESIHAVGRHLYVVYPIGIGVSKLSSNLIERRLGTRGTGRNWNTVLKVAGMI